MTTKNTITYDIMGKVEAQVLDEATLAAKLKDGFQIVRSGTKIQMKYGDYVLREWDVAVYDVA